MKTRMVAAVLMIAALGYSASARFMNRSVKVPVDRAVANVEKWIKEKPADAQAYYVLGRLHAMAWAYGPELNLWRPMPQANGAGAPAGNPTAATQGGGAGGVADPFEGQLPDFGPYDAVQVRREPKKEITASDAGHLQEAVRNYRKAVELDPKSGIYELGL